MLSFSLLFLRARGTIPGLSLRRTTEIQLLPGEQSTDLLPRAVEKGAHRSAKKGRKNLSGAASLQVKRAIFLTQTLHHIQPPSAQD